MIKRVSKFLLIMVILLFFAQKAVIAGDVCSFVGSDESCQNAPVGALCDAGGVEGVCAPKSRTAGIISCVCVVGKPHKTHKCKEGYRWSPVKNQCLKPMGSSPDGSVNCIPPYYWYGPDNNCEILF
ncbi:hypothetical protein [Hippea maritima]|uniref:Uncharacterized protein n=1 Tax=Hippea maritima (strain ATCC 700847 / DSM 10411 / MH2) TaxID=760142 RepID=F2LXQ6_HIPMA|nr:hypothetical protein [Hippea maritima]AEA34297.1 hypothetical protein Hipma_1340 [Hippea maritima DSM 10411]